jgi:hypothetical protein
MEKIFQPDYIDEKYEIIKKLGSGTYGTVY